MWIQALAIVLPRVQQHFSVPDSFIGTLSSSMFAGMMIGAVGWGTCSDIMGRSTAFNATLFFTALFGLLASFARSFWMLCALLFLLGSAVGGSMPTDGTLLLEHMPGDKQYLVTVLSVFFSLGSVLAAFVGLFIIPKHSCLPNQPCNPSTDNKGWQYMFVGLSLITSCMFLGRIVFFRLHESPRYLVHAGRHQEALKNLQLISQFNGSEISLELEDVCDRRLPEPVSGTNGFANSDERVPFLSPSAIPDPSLRSATTPLFDASANGGAPPGGNGIASTQLSGDEAMKGYRATDESPNSLENHPFTTPVEEVPPRVHNAERDISSTGSGERMRTTNADTKRKRPTPPRGHPSERQSRSRTSSIVVEEMERRFGGMLTWTDRLLKVLSPQWLRTTILVWGTWLSIALAYTIFNVYFPKLLELSSGDEVPRSLEDNLWDVVIFTLGGCPGAILGAYMIEGPLGRRGSLAGMTAFTALCCLMFVQFKGPLLIRLSSLGISLCSTTMYAVLYGWTPEIFGTEVRGTACGMASALSRIGSMFGPLLGGVLLVINPALPVYASIVVYLLATVFVLLLREPGSQRSERSFAH
ncbi:major facilitator superfamily domain-containing protein [Scleroderma yunnanense]